MKKLAVIIALATVVGTSFGQGFVNFVNGAASNVTTNDTTDVYGAAYTGPGASVGSQTGLQGTSGALPQGFYYALLMQPYAGGATNNPTASTVLSGGWLYTGTGATNALGAGRLSGGATAGTTQNDGVGSGNQFIVVGWSSNVATNGLAGWLTVSNCLAAGSWSTLNGGIGYFGVSTVGTGVGQPNTSPEQLFGGATGIQSGFTLFAVPVPEPSTMALAGLGGLSLLLFRRRK